MGTALHSGEHAVDQASALLFHLHKAREGCQNAHVIGIRSMDARNERLRDLFQTLATEPARDEGGEAFIALLLSARHEDLHAHAQLPRPGNERGLGHGPERGRHHQHHAFRQGVQAFAGIDEGSLELVVGRQQLGFEAEMAGEVHGPDLFGEEAVRPAFDEELVVLFGQDFAAGAVVLFKQQHVNGLPIDLGPGLEMNRRCQAGDPAAYDDDFQHD